MARYCTLVGTLKQASIVGGKMNAMYATNFLTEEKALEALALFKKVAQDPNHMQRAFFPVRTDKEFEYEFIKIKK